MKISVVYISVAVIAIVAGCKCTHRSDPDQHISSATLPSPASASNQRLLIPYDDFQNPQTSENLWQKDIGGGGTVSFDGGRATLDMSSTNMQKRARFNFPFTTTFAAVDGRFRISWDQQIVGDGANAFGAGFGIVSHSTMLLNAGQLGAASGEESPAPYCFFITKFDESNSSSMIGGTDKHHFELLVTPGESVLKVYRYHADFDAAPEFYATSGKLLEMMKSPDGLGIIIPANVPLSLIFWNECVTADDHFSVWNNRGVIAIQNVCVDIPLSARTPTKN